MTDPLGVFVQAARNTFLQYKYSDKMGAGGVGVHALTAHHLTIIGIPTLTGVTLEVLITDVSKWNGDVDFAKMKAAGAAGTVIKCGQGVAKDPYFDRHRERAKSANLPWSSYWFYDSRVHPYEQAKLWADFLDGDYGQLPHMADYEENYVGAYRGAYNFFLFVSEFQRLTGLTNDQIGIYTGYYYWVANSSKDYNVFFAAFWLWLAWYSPLPDGVIVPKPWSQERMLFWQFTSNGDGPKYGSTGLDVDLSYYLKTKDEFYVEFHLEEPIPPTGEPMNKLTVLTSYLNGRLAPGGEINFPAGATLSTGFRAGDVLMADQDS